MKETSYLDDNIQVVDMLKRIDTFQNFKSQDIKSFLNMAKMREYDKGETLIREGEYDCWLYFLLKGSLHIVKDDKILATLQRTGELFGEMGVIDGSPRSASIVAASRCLVLGMDGSLIERKLGDSDLRFCYLVYRVFAEVLAIRLRNTTEEFIKYRHASAALGKG